MATKMRKPQTMEMETADLTERVRYYADSLVQHTKAGNLKDAKYAVSIITMCLEELTKRQGQM